MTSVAASSAAEELSELTSLLQSGAVKCAGNVLRLKKACEELKAAAVKAPDPSAKPDTSAAPATAPAAAPAASVTSAKRNRPATRLVDPNMQFVPIDSFGWDQSDKNVSIYVRGLDGVGSLEDRKNNIVFNAEANSFDLQVLNLKGKNYRLCKDNLDKSIDPGKSKVKVKSDRIVLLLRKVPGKYGAEHWSDLIAKRQKKKKEAGGKEDPMGGIMDLMKDMYDSGDDQMRATIGKAMMDARLGKKPKEPSMPSFDNDLGGKTTI